MVVDWIMSKIFAGHLHNALLWLHEHCTVSTCRVFNSFYKRSNYNYRKIKILYFVIWNVLFLYTVISFKSNFACIWNLLWDYWYILYMCFILIVHYYFLFIEWLWVIMHLHFVSIWFYCSSWQSNSFVPWIYLHGFSVYLHSVRPMNKMLLCY